MAEPETEDLGPQTPEEKMAWWQMCRIAIDYKRKNLTRKEALAQFSYWAELPTGICWMLMLPMSKESVAYLRRAFPDWITKDKEPGYDDVRKATRAGNLNQRKLSGHDAAGRDNRGYWRRYRSNQTNLD